MTELSNQFQQPSDLLCYIVRTVINKGVPNYRIKHFQMTMFKIIEFVFVNFLVQNLELFLDDPKEYIVLVGFQKTLN